MKHWGPFTLEHALVQCGATPFYGTPTLLANAPMLQHTTIYKKYFYVF